jgi:hypothetical protein
MQHTTTFDINAPYIYLPIFVLSAAGKLHEFDAILDTGAPRTEFSDKALVYAGFFRATKDVELKSGLQTQKYDKTVLPQVDVCGCTMLELEVLVSHFEESWGIDALIGLDFFRRFKVEIDYSKGIITTLKLAG